VKTPAIALTDVTKRFGSHAALDRVSLEVASAEAVVILGPSGCGKTTLLRIVAGLEIAETGQVVLGGTPVGAAGRTIIPPHRRNIGFVFQDLALWPHLTVLQNLDFVLGSGGVSRAERTRRGQELLALVRAGLFADRYPHQLSGGEQQRVALARALVGKPQTLLLDEPLSSLDPDLRAELRSEIARLQRELGFTMLYVTHDREDAAALADRVVEMHGGRILRTQQVRTPPHPEERA
jgi:ABC-type Fe3+/spermidine/putrescine transport system ATPase subunit